MFRSLSLSTKMLLTFVPLFVIGIDIGVYINNRYQEEEMQKQALSAANEKAMIVRESLVNMMVESQQVDDRYLEKVKQIAHLNDLYIRLDTSKLRLAEDYMDSTRISRLAARIATAKSKGDVDNEYGNQVLMSGKQQWIRLGDDFKAMVPFVAEKKCQRCHDVQIGDVLGVAHLDFPLTPIIEENDRNSLRSASITGGIVLILLLAGAFFFRLLVTRPLKVLESAAAEIADGNLSGAVALPSGHDEVGRLAGAFGRMRNALRQSQDAVKISTVGQVASALVQNFRTPVKRIDAAVEGLKRPSINEQDRTVLLQEAQDSSRQMMSMTQDLLDFTAGSITVDKRLTQIAPLLRSVTASVKPGLDKQRIGISVVSQYDGQALIDADRTRRALENIITYAANYIPAEGKITLESDSLSGMLTFTISDNGSGIPRAFRDRIFDPFTKIVQSSGIGLDLAIAKMIIEKHGGTISVTSEEGSGTRYTIHLPM